MLHGFQTDGQPLRQHIHFEKKVSCSRDRSSPGCNDLLNLHNEQEDLILKGPYAIEGLTS